MLDGEFPPAAQALASFRDAMKNLSGSEREEVYTSVFDLQPRCAPYVAYQLCGESRQRTLFLIRLKEIYREHGFETGGELPDHLTEVIGFLAHAPESRAGEELASDGVLPALEKMLGSFGDDDAHPYRFLLQALRNYLSKTYACSRETATSEEKETA